MSHYIHISVLFLVSGSAQSWVEIAFGTKSGIVRVIVQHPENVGQGLQVFRTFVAHTCPVIKIVLGEKHLITGMTCDVTANALYQNKSVLFLC